MRSMGVDAGDEGERAGEALREWHAAGPADDPVAVVPAGATAPVVRLSGPAAGEVSWTLRLEDGGEWHGLSSPTRCACRTEFRWATTRSWSASPRHTTEIQVLAARGRPTAPAATRFGFFLPLYAHGGGYGVGDFTALGELAAWGADRGGELAGGTPLMAAFLDRPFEPSPYRPCRGSTRNESP